MVARKRRRVAKQKLSTRFKKNPIGTTKSQFKSLGPVGQIAVIGIAAGYASARTAQKLNKLPVLGSVFDIFTTWGASLKRKMK
jgi:hypothetical protein